MPFVFAWLRDLAGLIPFLFCKVDELASSSISASVFTQIIKKKNNRKLLHIFSNIQLFLYQMDERYNRHSG